MSFQKRAIDACMRDFESGVIVETHIRDVLKLKNVDVSCFERFFDDASDEVRLSAARIIAEKGNVQFLVDKALNETNREMLINLISIIGKEGVGLDVLCGLLSSEDTIVRDAAVDMFRRAGQPNALFPLVFDTDENVVKRIKRYINEARHD